MDGIRPGVSHTRGLVLADGVVVMLDCVESNEEHNYDLVYHNFGDLTFAPGWQASPSAPLGKTGNYENILEPVKLAGIGPLKATWDLKRQYPIWDKSVRVDESRLPAVNLAFWQLPVEGGQLFSGATGLNNTNTMVMSDRAPTIIHRVRARRVEFATVLEPFKGTPRVALIAREDAQRVLVTLASGKAIHVSLEELIQRHTYQH